MARHQRWFSGPFPVRFTPMAALLYIRLWKPVSSNLSSSLNKIQMLPKYLCSDNLRSVTNEGSEQWFSVVSTSICGRSRAERSRSYVLFDPFLFDFWRLTSTKSNGKKEKRSNLEILLNDSVYRYFFFPGFWGDQGKELVRSRPTFLPEEKKLKRKMSNSLIHKYLFWNKGWPNK